MKSLKRKVRICSGMLLVLFFLLSLACPAYAAGPEAPIKVFLNGTALVMDVSPVQKEGRTLVPFRAIGEALMAEVDWDGSAGKVTLTLEDKTAQLVIGDKTAYVNGKATTLDVPAMLVEGRTMVPLRFIGESLGASVQWSEELRRIDITTATGAPPAPAAPEPSVKRPLSQVMVYISLDDEGEVHPDIRQTAGMDDVTYNCYLKLMAQPGLAGKTVGIVYDFVGMRIVDGPVEKDGITWWKLEGHGKSGWADERCLKEIEGEWDSQVESAIAWAIENIGRTDYSYKCLRFVQDAYRNGGLTLTGMPWGSAKNAATIFNAEANKDKIVPRGAAVFYNWEGTVGGTTQNWGHVGIALETGKYDEIDIINALEYVSIEPGAYLAHYTAMDYIGWAWIFNKK
ncbi:MAG: copper amine oxidase N-terminal domain-containing protein [Firmicutes bacterium]|nr:copper amine oxidase N-terminal domain-containing protein [Bacillota bacterium]